MGTLILIFILVFIVWPVVKAIFHINQARKTARDIFSGSFSARQQQDESPRKPGWSAPAARAKIITKDVGEYVSFQELPPDSDSPHTSATISSSESQISDAEWEDIK